MLRVSLPAGFVAILAAASVASAQSPHARSLAPFVASPQRIVERMLELASVKPGETVFDLGSGDGRILVTAVQRFRAKAVGVELSERWAKLSTETILKLGLSGQARVIQGDMQDVDISGADVVTLYLLRDSNDSLRPKLEKSLRIGARVVSHDYEIRGWKPTLVDKTEAYSRHHTLYLYELPLKK